MLFFYTLLSLANLRSRFFSPNFLKLTVALESLPLPSILIISPMPNFSCETLSPSDTFILIEDNDSEVFGSLFSLDFEL